MTKIFTFDIETSPHEGYHWGVWQQNIAGGQIIRPTQMLTWAGKFLGDKRITYRTWEDEGFLDDLHDMLEAADIVVGFNHVKFDLRHANREFLLAGMRAVRPHADVDMLKVVKSLYDFPHYRLDYVAKVILDESKLETGGFDLWPAFMRGEKKAQRVMRKYNIQDVRITEKLYLKLRPWVRTHPYTGPIPDGYIKDGDESYQCPVCDSNLARRDRPRRTRCFAIRVLECMDCGHWFDGKRRKL